MILYVKVKPKKVRLPDFVVMGAAKCGTTSIHHNIRSHPDIHMPPREMHYFDWRPWQHPEMYGKEVSANNPNKKRVIGEKTPTYLYYRPCHKRLHEILPNAQLIVAIRNPADRWISEWKMISQREKRWREPHRLLDEQIETFEKDLQNPIAELGHHLSHGYYWFSLENLLRFFPRKQLHVVITENLAKDATLEYNKIFEFLGVPYYKKNWEKRLRVRRKTCGLSFRRRLVEFYQPYNDQLRRELKIDLPEWTPTIGF